ncbi:MAG: NYN domain-containing protein [Planctomycetes bacterium]|nr:NYN domain-containing protein [Planctomycetota bacterium]
MNWLLIDGSNVVHQDAELRRLAGIDPERARAELERLLGGRHQTMVFWDGGPGGEVRSFMRKGIRVDYSGPGEADERIVAWLKHHGPKSAVVISDDGPLTRRCRTLGARIASARGFAAGLRTTRDAPYDRPPPTPAEVEFWMREFQVKPGE